MNDLLKQTFPSHRAFLKRVGEPLVQSLLHGRGGGNRFSHLSVIYMDQEQDLTVAYMMNLMRSGLVGDMRGFGLVFAAATAAAS